MMMWRGFVRCPSQTLGSVSTGGTVVPLVFFFQAEDGIRDWSVTGVQTCALPISRGVRAPGLGQRRLGRGRDAGRGGARALGGGHPLGTAERRARERSLPRARDERAHRTTPAPARR